MSKPHPCQSCGSTNTTKAYFETEKRVKCNVCGSLEVIPVHRKPKS